MGNAATHLIWKLLMFKSKSFLDMSVFWYAFISVATPSLRGVAKVYTLCRSMFP